MCRNCDLKNNWAKICKLKGGSNYQWNNRQVNVIIQDDDERDSNFTFVSEINAMI